MGMIIEDEEIKNMNRENSGLVADDSIEIAEMTACLEEYYEAAGFADFYDRVLSTMDDNKIRESFHRTFDGMTVENLEMWGLKGKEKCNED